MKSLLIAIFVVALWALLDLSRPAGAGEALRPNVLVILADDMGFADAGCYGSEIQTPNLDKLAAGGLRFTQFYNTSRCWSSRASLLTGYYAQQVRRDQLPGVPGGGVNGKRPRWARLLPELLKPLGYRTYYSGKWHIDGTPAAGGFDRSYDYSDTDHHFLATAPTGDDSPLEPIQGQEGYYASSAVADHAIRQLRDHDQKYAGRPFFQYIAFTEPHFPLQAPREEIDRYRTRYLQGWDVLRQQRFKNMTDLGIIHCALSPLDRDLIPKWNLSEEKLREQIGPGEVVRAVAWDGLTDEQKQFQPIKMAIHAAMIHRMDTQIGRVLDQLKSMNATENTLVLFLSDNGASAEMMIRGDGHDPAAPIGSAKTFVCLGPAWSSAANTPLRLHKSWVHEGGISTPLIACWPRGIAAHGELRQNPGHLIDLAPTILELAGGTWPAAMDGEVVPAPPGKSLVPVFAKDNCVSHDFFWFYHEGHRAIRMGDWKLVCAGGRDAPWELYDLSVDRCESQNLASQHPDKVKELADAWTRHMEEFRDLAKRDLPPVGGNGVGGTR